MKHSLRTKLAAAAALASIAMALTPGVGGTTNGPEGSIIWSPGNPLPRHDAVFTVSAQNANGPIASATIDYGDGVIDQIFPTRSAAGDLGACLFGDRMTATRTHQYRQTGSYDVILTVRSAPCPGLSVVQGTQDVKQRVLTVVEQATASGDQSQQSGSSGTQSQPLIPTLTH